MHLPNGVCALCATHSLAKSPPSTWGRLPDYNYGIFRHSRRSTYERRIDYLKATSCWQSWHLTSWRYKSNHITIIIALVVCWSWHLLVNMLSCGKNHMVSPIHDDGMLINRRLRLTTPVRKRTSDGESLIYTDITMRMHVQTSRRWDILCVDYSRSVYEQPLRCSKDLEWVCEKLPLCFHYCHNTRKYWLVLSSFCAGNSSQTSLG